ncbi:hypothetical protein B484DRAFT_426691 [Ochromonadaceae sp. CCMP2298]|nr:hypothetical protein B484DRAFT_426691 [Ochromonadaceae sp. CCMP2298]
MQLRISLTLCLLLLLCISLDAFRPAKIHTTQSTSTQTALYGAMFAYPPTPEDSKARMAIQIRGKVVNNALFRAELKKELTFFRGCSALYIQLDEDTAEIVTEGKTAQILSFTTWLHALSLTVTERKPNFQGPIMEAKVVAAEWLPFEGTLKGFNAAADAPTLAPKGSEGGETFEAKSMAGTDESV